MAGKDLRDWIDKLQTEGMLKTVSAEVNWDRELGAIVRNNFDHNGPALLFDNIKGHADTAGKKIFTGGLSTKERAALMLGLSKDESMGELVAVTRKRFQESIKPIEVKNGPVKENILKGDDVDISQFPVPLWHKGDGGRYINTAAGVVTRDPETGWINIGIYRGMIISKNKIGLGLAPSQHWGLHYVKYQKMKKPMPVAFVYGYDPSLFFVGSAGILANTCEYDVMGSVRQEPVELIKCETSDLLVPAFAEIVIEGSITTDPSEFEMEGPFGEYTGYFGGAVSLKPVAKIDCITHRNDPIFRGSLEGFGPNHPNETGIMQSLSVPANVWNALDRNGIPGVIDVGVLPGSCVNTAAVKIQKKYFGHAKEVALCIWGAGLPMWYCKNVIVVDDDIDIHNFESLEWAVAYRVDAGSNDIVIVPGTKGSPLDPSIPWKYRVDFVKYGASRWDRVLIDATINWEHEPQEQYGGKRYPPVSFLIDPEDRELIEKRWNEYGID